MKITTRQFLGYNESSKELRRRNRQLHRDLKVLTTLTTETWVAIHTLTHVTIQLFEKPYIPPPQLYQSVFCGTSFSSVLTSEWVTDMMKKHLNYGETQGQRRTRKWRPHVTARISGVRECSGVSFDNCSEPVPGACFLFWLGSVCVCVHVCACVCVCVCVCVTYGSERFVSAFSTMVHWAWWGPVYCAAYYIFLLLRKKNPECQFTFLTGGM